MQNQDQDQDQDLKPVATISQEGFPCIREWVGTLSKATILFTKKVRSTTYGVVLQSEDGCNQVGEEWLACIDINDPKYYRPLTAVVYSHSKDTTEPEAPKATTQCHCHPAPPTETKPAADPGEGYRLLGFDDTIQKGDEFQLMNGAWDSSVSLGATPRETGFTYRRATSVPYSEPVIPASPGYRLLDPAEAIRLGDDYRAKSSHATWLTLTSPSDVAIGRKANEYRNLVWRRKVTRILRMLEEGEIILPTDLVPDGDDQITLVPAEPYAGETFESGCNAVTFREVK